MIKKRDTHSSNAVCRVRSSMVLTAVPRSLSLPTKDSLITLADHGRRIGKNTSRKIGKVPESKEAAVKKLLSAIFFLCTIITTASAHHSFAIYDQTKTVTLTGRLTRFVLVIHCE